MATSGEIQRPPMGRIAWPPSVMEIGTVDEAEVQPATVTVIITATTRIATHSFRDLVQNTLASVGFNTSSAGLASIYARLFHITELIMASRGGRKTCTNPIRVTPISRRPLRHESIQRYPIHNR